MSSARSTDAMPPAQGEANLAVNAEAAVQAEPGDPGAAPEDAHIRATPIDIAALVEFLQDIAASDVADLPPEVIEALTAWANAGDWGTWSGDSDADLILAALPDGAAPVPDQSDGLLEWMGEDDLFLCQSRAFADTVSQDFQVELMVDEWTIAHLRRGELWTIRLRA